MGQRYSEQEPARAEIDALRGPAVIEFGANWCGICAAARPTIDKAFAAYESLPHLKIADGPGQPLGRSFKVKLWPTLVFLMDGKEVERIVRPQGTAEMEAALGRLVG